MNTERFNWESGDASGGASGFGGTAAGAGYSAGDGNPEHFFQFPGSLTHLALLDTNTRTGLANGLRDSLQPGRYNFPVRNGAPPGSATITGVVRDQGGATQAAAPVRACPTGGGSCVVGLTGADGRYTIVGVTPGSFALTANPPAGSNLLPGHAGPLTVATGATLTQDLVLTGPQAPPAGTTITDHGTTAAGIPVLYSTDPLTLTTAGCVRAGGNVQYTLTQGATGRYAAAPWQRPLPGRGTSPRR